MTTRHSFPRLGPNPRVITGVGIFQAFDIRVNAPSSTKAGPIEDHSDFAPFAASSANTRESMEVELAKWSCQQRFFFAARVLGNLSRLKA